MKNANFDNQFQAYFQATTSLFDYLMNYGAATDLLTALNVPFTTQKLGASFINDGEQIALLRSRKDVPSDIFLSAEEDMDSPFAVIIPADSYLLSSYKFLYFTKLEFDKETTKLKAEVEVKSGSELGLSYNASNVDLRRLAQTLNHVNHYAAEGLYETLVTNGDGWADYGDYLTTHWGPAKGQPNQGEVKGYNSTDTLLSEYFNVNSLYKKDFRFEREGYDRQEYLDDMEERESINREMYG